MEKRTELEKMIVELKLAKRELVLLGKNTKWQRQTRHLLITAGSSCFFKTAALVFSKAVFLCTCRNDKAGRQSVAKFHEGYRIEPDSDSKIQSLMFA